MVNSILYSNIISQINACIWILQCNTELNFIALQFLNLVLYLILGKRYVDSENIICNDRCIYSKCTEFFQTFWHQFFIQFYDTHSI